MYKINMSYLWMTYWTQKYHEQSLHRNCSPKPLSINTCVFWINPIEKQIQSRLGWLWNTRRICGWLWLDYAGRYRQLPYLATLKKSVYSGERQWINNQIPPIHPQNYYWTLSLAERKLAGLCLLFLFAEASFFPIPPMYCWFLFASANESFCFALICSIASVLETRAMRLGLLWDTLANWFYDFIPGFTPKIWSHSYLVWRMGLASYFWRIFSHSHKIFTVASGVLAWQSCRFFWLLQLPFPHAFLVAFLLAKFGEPMKDQIEKHFNLLAFLFGILFIGGIFVLKFLKWIFFLPYQ